MTISAENLAPCQGIISDSLELIFNENTSVFAGQNATICEGNSYTLSEATEENTTSLLWTTNGDGVFDVPSNLNATYTPGPNDISNGVVTLILSATGSPPCGGATDSIDITIIQTPEISVPNTSIVWCTENLPVTLDGIGVTNYDSILWSSSGTGSFNDNTIINPEYTPSAQDLVLGVDLTISAIPQNNCAIISETINVQFEESVIVDAGDNGLICEGENFQISNASTNAVDFIWSTNGDGVFINENTLAPTYVPGPLDINNGSVIIELTALANGNCFVNSNDDILLTITQEATSNAGPTSDVICEGEIYLLTGTASNYVTINWLTSGDGIFGDAGSLNTSYTPGPTDILNGLVTLTLEAVGDIPCNNLALSSIDLFIEEGTNVFAGEDASICFNEGFYQINDASVSPNNFQSLSWTTSGTGFFSDQLKLIQFIILVHLI